MSYGTNESAAHIWPLLALSSITVITPQKQTSPFSRSQILLLLLIFTLITGTHPPCISLSLFFHSKRDTFTPPPPSPLCFLGPPSFSRLPVTSSAEGDARDPASAALSLLSDRPQSQFLPLSAAEVYTHGKLIPVPCLPHIVLMSKKTMLWRNRGWHFGEIDTLWEAITLRNNT